MNIMLIKSLKCRIILYYIICVFAFVLIVRMMISVLSIVTIDAITPYNQRKDKYDNEIFIYLDNAVFMETLAMSAQILPQELYVETFLFLS